MKKILFSALALCALCALPASAQFATSANSNGAAAKSSSTNDITAYSRASVSYVGRDYVYDVKNADDFSTSGIGASYIKGFSISQTMPLFVEAGVKADVGFGSIENEDNEDVSLKLTTLRAAVPVNLAYRFALPGSEITISPYAGVGAKFNLLGTMKYAYDGDNSQLQDKIDDMDPINLFDKDDTSKDTRWTRFQMGWQIGAVVDFGKYFANIEYGKDFSEISKKLGTSQFAIGVGMNF